MKTVIITGATSGYGLATAKKFKENGYTTIIVSRDEKKTKDCFEKYGFDDYFVMDVTDYSKWTELKDYVIKKYSKLDVLVNNAGGGVCIDDAENQTKESIDKCILLNLNSIIYSANVFDRVFKEQGFGTVINISSVCAKHSWRGWSVYAAAKAGVLNFTKGQYVELRPYGARATCIIPAAAATGFQASAGIGEESQTLQTRDIADAVFFAAEMPSGAFVEEMTVWGISQDVQPL